MISRDSQILWRMIFVIILITLSASILRPESSPQEHDRFVIWNIGQGQWTSLISENFCDHFDVGGEFDLSQKVLQTCGARVHRIHISHWDWDHMGFIQKLRRKKIDLCLWNYPLGPASAKKKEVLAGLPICSYPDFSYQTIFKGDSRSTATSNDTSQVVATHEILIPGDSTRKEEKIWCSNPRLRTVRGIILGHHGSRSSTSELLLSHLSSLRWAVATARKRRYGHPHEETVARLKNLHIPLLKTEDWGSLVFEL